MQATTVSDPSARRSADPDPGSGFWMDTVITSARLSPVALALSLAVVLLGAFAWMAWWMGALDRVQADGTGFWSYREFRLGLLVASLAGYLPVARFYITRSALRIRYALEPWLDTDDGEIETFVELDHRASMRAGLWALSVLPISALVIDRDPSLYWQPGYWNPLVMFAWVVGSWVGWWLGSLVYVTLAYGRRLSLLADSLRPIDLLDLESAAPFARHGLSTSLLWVLLVSLIALNVVDLVWFAVTSIAAVAVGLVALVLPVRGVHRRLRDAKRAELLRIDRALRGDTEALRGSSLARRADALSVADLLAWRSHVDGIREWPFDTVTIVRFGLYLAIPLGSWLGGAFVERLLGAVLD